MSINSMNDLLDFINQNKLGLLGIYNKFWNETDRGALFVDYNNKKKSVDVRFIKFDLIKVNTIKQNLDKLYHADNHKDKVYFLANFNEQHLILDIVIDKDYRNIELEEKKIENNNSESESNS